MITAVNAIIRELVELEDELRLARDEEEEASIQNTKARQHLDQKIVARRRVEARIGGTAAALDALRERDDISTKTMEEMLQAARQFA